ncbi:hypothetical protein KAW18_07350 [candidate division WOR-3 bacterium]|nr:hypothetical protein [candidate division WOR-3 bacterium]
MFNCLVILIFMSAWESYLQNDYGARTMGAGGVIPTEVVELENIPFNPAGLTGLNNLLFSIGCQRKDGEVYFFSIFSIFESDYILYETSEFLPSYIGVAFPFGKNYALSFSASIPYKKRETSSWWEETTVEHPEGTGRYLRLVETKRFYAINTSAAWMVNERLSIGMNLAWLLENYRFAIEYKENKADNESRLCSEQFGIEPSIGIQYEVDSFFTIVTNIRKGFVKGHYDQSVMDYETNHLIVIETTEEETLPLIFSFGFCAKASNKIFINFSGEFINWEGVTYKYDGDSDNPDYLRNVIRGHMGIEFRLSSAAYRIGLYTDPCPLNTLVKRDQVFLTAGAGYEFGPVRFDLAVTSSRLTNPVEKKETNIFFSTTYTRF